MASAHTRNIWAKRHNNNIVRRIMRKTVEGIFAVICIIAVCFALGACDKEESVKMESDLSVDTSSDIGLYFFDNDGNHARYSEDITEEFFDEKKPTVAYFHGWIHTKPENPDNVAGDGEFVRKAKAQGYNVCSLNYTNHAQALQSLFNYIWMGYEDSHSVACRFAREYAACFKDYTGDVTFISHSYGAHTSTATAYLLAKMAEQGIVPKTCLPKRMTYADPYFGDAILKYSGGGIKGDRIENLGEKINGRSCTEVVADAMQYLADEKNVVIDVYCGMPMAYDQFLDDDKERKKACKDKLYDTGVWTILKGLQREYGKVGDIHNITLDWVFDSFFVPVKTEDGKYFPTASLDNEKTRALKGKLFESTLEGLDVENDTLVEIERSW